MTSLDGLFLALVILPVIYVSTFFHELGHALCSRLGGLEVGSFGLGTGKPFWVGRWFGSKFFLCRKQPFHGFCFTLFPRLEASPWKKLFFASGGILAHLVLMAASLGLWLRFSEQRLWPIVAGYNGIALLINALPFTASVGAARFRSDGALLLEILRKGFWPTPFALVLQATRHLRGLWEAIGDPRSLQSYLGNSSLAWYALGDPEHALQVVEEAQALSVKSLPALQALLRAVRGRALAKTGRREEALAELAEAEGAMRQLELPHGLFLVHLYRGSALHNLHETTQAVEVLEGLTSSPLLARHTPLRLSLLQARLEVFCSLGDGKKVAAVRAEYEALPAGYRSGTMERDVSRSLGRFLLARGQEAEAFAFFRRTLNAVRALDLSLTDPEDRERFRRCQADLLIEIQECLQAAGKTKEAEEAGAVFHASDQDALRKREREVRNARRLLRWGIGVWVVNLVLVLIVLLTSDVIEDLQDSSFRHVLVRLGLLRTLFIFLQLLASVYKLSVSPAPSVQRRRATKVLRS